MQKKLERYNRRLPSASVWTQYLVPYPVLVSVHSLVCHQTRAATPQGPWYAGDLLQCRVYLKQVLTSRSINIKHFTPRMLDAALKSFDNLISIQSRQDSARNSILDTMMHPWRQDSLYLRGNIFYTPSYNMLLCVPAT